MGRVLAVDIGASSLKVGLFAPDGPSLAQAEAPTGVQAGPEGRSEIDPARWRAALEAALAEVARTAGGLGEVAAVCACGMTRTQVFVDAGGAALGPAIGVLDARAGGVAAEGRALQGLSGPAAEEAARLDPSHPVARLAWFAREAPEVFARAAAVVEPKDWLNALLTGVVGSDPISMERVSAAYAGDASLAAAMGVSRDLRAPLAPPEGVIGRVRAGLGGALEGLAGAQVLSGCHDARMAAAGLGALRPGGAYVISGTTESAGVMATAPARAEGLLTVRWDEGLWQIGGPGLNGAAVADWAARLGAARPGPPPARALLFLPFLKGERAPLWDADLRAAYLGLDAGHGPADLARATMEGLGFLNRMVIERAEAAAGLRAEAVALAGGGAAEPWPAIRAAALGRPVEVPALRHAGLAGCAAAALVALGRAGSLAEGARAVSGPPRVVAPDPGLAPRMDALFEVFKDAVAPVAALSARLAQAPALPEGGA